MNASGPEESWRVSLDEGQHLQQLPVAALILDAHLKSALVAIRSLGEKGISVCAGSHRLTAMGRHSRYVAKSFLYPSPIEDRAGFLEAVTRQARDLGDCAVFAFSDSTLLPLVENRESLPHSLRWVLPSSFSDFLTAFDKSLTVKLAQSIGIEVPRTFWCKDLAELEAIGQEIGYPVVIKPLRTVSWTGNFGVQRTSVFAFSADELQSKFRTALRETGELPMLQQYIDGEETGVEFMSQDGALLAACAHRRVRSGSPAGGSGVVTQTVPLEYCGTGERAEKLVAALRWSGPIMVEFKISKRSRIPYLMEVNGRFWGSMPLAKAAGVDFSSAYFNLALGKTVQPTREYKVGVTSRHFLGDCAHLRSVLFKNDSMRPLAYPTRFAALKKFFFSPRSTPAVFDVRDIKPIAAELIDFSRVTLMKWLGTADTWKSVIGSKKSSRKQGRASE